MFGEPKDPAVLAAENAARQKAAAERAAAARAAAGVSAAQELQSALKAVDFGEKACSATELRVLRVAIERGRAEAVPAEDVARAVEVERLAIGKAEALAAAQRAAAEQAAKERAEAQAREVEMQKARELLRRSIARPAAERKKIIRDLQVQWHPDKQSGDENALKFADELSRLANEAASVARKQEAAAAAKKNRMEAYDTLQQVMNGKVQEGLDRGALRVAIDNARKAGVSDTEIARAEGRLKQR